MRLKDFDYNLPKGLIAQKPKQPRDQARLLAFNRATGKVEHKHFYDIINYLQPGDVLVLNNSKVFPARLIGKKKDTGGKLEIFLLRPPSITPPASPPPLGKGRIKLNGWQCLVGGHGRKEGREIKFKRGLRARILQDNQDGTWLVQFNKSKQEVMKIAEKIGQTPTPPYIKKLPAGVKRKYQTVFAAANKVGSVAAPTAGFHFTKNLLAKLKRRGVKIIYLTLHVGLGTFAPVKVDNIKKHKMHGERVEVNIQTIQKIVRAKEEGQRIIAVGTTSARALEGVFSQPARQLLGDLTNQKEIKTEVDIFIYPGYKFKVIDALITNFHLPKSTLLILVAAFLEQPNKRQGIKLAKKIYRAAIRKKYRFYSFGDAMLVT
ncbi:MAG: tRNA preQ1(34) S-adenosylmethionine ribosyltransferase-isomerase QueA [Patescibacteria group bacterium]